MNKVFGCLLTGLLLFLVACDKGDTDMDTNPFFGEYGTPFETPPYEIIKNEHYLPAFYKGIEQQNEEINKIIRNEEAPDFENTILALEESGKLLREVSGVFNNLKEADTNDELNEAAKEISPVLSKHSDEIMMNDSLFARIKSVYDNMDKSVTDTVQRKVVEEYYKDFVRSGALLNGEKKERMKEINQRLSVLTLEFGDKVLKETNNFELVITDTNDLAGLPESVIESARDLAEKSGKKEGWLFNIQKPSLLPFLQFSEKRELREKMFKGYISKGDRNNENDTKEIIKEIVELRHESANLLGFETHAAYVLDDNMAKTPENVYKRLDELWTPALNAAKKELADMQEIADKENAGIKLEAWDWWYYANKVKKARYDFNEEDLRPYFKLENVREGAFEVANKLFNITFKERDDIQVYHPEVKVYEVLNSDGSHVGILYTDYFPRASKRGGAWMDAIRKEEHPFDKAVSPIIYNVANLSKPTGDKPALLSLDETLTLFHEFGHALHGLLTNVKYRKLSGTAVARDFVELPSQIMENWALEPEVLKMYAKHYKTGEAMPDSLIEKINNSGHFNQGFELTEYLAAAYLDMDWHVLEKFDNIDVNEFEKASMDKIGLIDEIVPRYRSTYYNHIFSGGYSAGYYSYVWAEILDADAFAAFKEKGIFDKELAGKYKKFILEKGGTVEPMKLYKEFRGKEPSVAPLLKRRGIN